MSREEAIKRLDAAILEHGDDCCLCALKDLRIIYGQTMKGGE